MKLQILMFSMLLAVLPITAMAQTDEAPASKETTAEDQAPKDQAAADKEASSDQGTAEAEENETSADQGTAENETSADQSAHVARAMFTTEVVDHEPVDQLDSLPAGFDRICFFTEIVDMSGEAITHRWLLDGEPVAEVPMEIGGPRWRVYSVKTLPSNTTGTWSVQVVDAAGAVMYESQLPFTPETSEADTEAASKETTTAAR